MRQIVLDTETTGLEISEGNRILEIGCVEVIDRKLTGVTRHYYINPERDSEEKALEVHGLTTEFLSDKPLFAEIALDFLDFIKGAELVIHNAPFDVGFLDHELSRLDPPAGTIADRCTILDTVLLARRKHPGQKVNLDTLCRRYGIDNSHRELHGALKDAELLAEVYLAMTGGQVGLSLGSADADDGLAKPERRRPVDRSVPLKVVTATNDEIADHMRKLTELEKNENPSLWQQLPAFAETVEKD